MLPQFSELFLQAQAEVLPPRSQRILEMRYGFGGDDPSTLAEIGATVNLSRERVRQIIERSLLRIRGRGVRRNRSGTSGTHDRSGCGQVLAYLLSALKPEEEGFVGRIITFISDEMPQLPCGRLAIMLVLGLVGMQRSPFFAATLAQVAAEEESYRQLLAAEKEERRRLIQRLRYQEKGDALFAWIIWPDQVMPVHTDVVCTRAREVDLEAGGVRGSFYSNKLQRQVVYESQTELKFFHLLETLDEIVFYQEQPCFIPYTIDEERHLYYPDVLFIFSDGRGVLAELKPVIHMGLHVNIQKWRALRAYCRERGLGFLITDGYRTPQDLVRLAIPTEFEQRVILTLEHGNMDWPAYRESQQGFELPPHALQAVIMRNKLIWRMHPFELALPTSRVSGHESRPGSENLTTN